MASGEWREKTEKLGGNADVFENKGVAKRAIRKLMKRREMQIDGMEGAIRKLLKTKERRKQCGHAGKERRKRERRGGGAEAKVVELKEGKELTGLAGTSWDIIPLG